MGKHQRSPSWLLALGGLCVMASPGIGCVTPQTVSPEVAASSSVGPPEDPSSFVDALSPYGQWVDLPDVGRVWQPSPAVVGSDFVPYATGGQWAMGDEGWTFDSDWNWGWAPFHYGRWLRAPQYGWVWEPGSEWAPAWVDWRSGDGFIGWAPLPPDGYVGEPDWFFVRQADFVRPHVFRYRLPPERAREAFHRATPVEPRNHGPGMRWSRGPEPTPVERETGRPVPRSRLHAPRSGQAFRTPFIREGAPVHTASPGGLARPFIHAEPAPAPEAAPEHLATPPGPGPAAEPFRPEVHEATPPHAMEPAAHPEVHVATPPHGH